MHRCAQGWVAGVGAGALAMGSTIVAMPVLAATEGPGASAVAASGITIAPTVELVDGVIRGNLHAVGAKGAKLRFQVLSNASGGKFSLGTVPAAQSSGGPQSFTVLPYANWLDGDAKGLQTFKVKVSEVALAGGTAATAVADIAVHVDQLAPGNVPVAFTYRVTSFDGVGISTNFFPAAGLPAGSTAPMVLECAGMGKSGNTDPFEVSSGQAFVPGTDVLRTAGYNVMTWDPRGEFGSGGTLQLDNPFFEGRDVSAIVDFAADQTPVQLSGVGDPSVGMVGGSYGGGIQLTVAGIDPRIDAIVPAVAWNSLNDSLNPGGVLNTGATSGLLAALSGPNVRMNPLVRKGLQAGVAQGKLSDSTKTMLVSSDVQPFLRQLQAPTLLVQSTDDALAPLEASIANAIGIFSNPFGAPVKMIWVDPALRDSATETKLRADAVAWLNKYVAGYPIPDAYFPSFQWWDQSGTAQSSDLLPFFMGFNQPTPISATSRGGTLTFTGAKATPSQGISMTVPIPVGAQIVGRPSLTFTYQGNGSGHAVFAQISAASGQAPLGNIVTPIPVTLDGKAHTVSLPLGDVIYTAGADARLIVKLSSSSPSYASAGSGKIAISDVFIGIPRRAS